MMRETMIGVGAALLLATTGCGGTMPEDLGPQNGLLGGCPESPNCVSSTAPTSDEQHSIAAFAIAGDSAAAWAALVGAVEGMDRHLRTLLIALGASRRQLLFSSLWQLLKVVVPLQRRQNQQLLTIKITRNLLRATMIII